MIVIVNTVMAQISSATHSFISQRENDQVTARGADYQYFWSDPV